MTASASTERARGIGPIGTIARVCTGLGLLYLAGFQSELQWYEVVLGLVGLPAIVMLIVIVSKRVLRTSSYLRATGPIGTTINLGIIVALFIIPWTTDIAYFFFGVPMFLAAWRGYPGCEVLAISNFVLRRDDQLGCPWFWPIDTLEERLTRKARANG